MASHGQYSQVLLPFLPWLALVMGAVLQDLPAAFPGPAHYL